MNPKKILWPTDFSGNAEKALPYVQSLTEKYGTEVHVLYVIEDLANHPGWYGDFENERIKEIVAWEEKTAKKRLDQTCKNHLEGCPLYIKHVAVGDPAREILKLIDEEKVDMVVMATTGNKGNFRFGSVAEKVVKNSAVPVVTIPVETG
jgi:nucleotide-binding universal stress UspA family protein